MKKNQLKIGIMSLLLVCTTAMGGDFFGNSVSQVPSLNKAHEAYLAHDVKTMMGAIKETLQKFSDDPSLNMSLDDPLLQDPQNVLKDEEIFAIKQKYSKKIEEQMLETISYPYEAKESHWEGIADLKITILPDGSVKDVVVSKSSGYAIFDKEAVETAEILSPYERFAPAKNLRELTVDVSVEYSEKAIFGTSDLQKNKAKSL